MNNNVCVGIMTSVNLINRFTACKDTWLKEFKYKYMFGGYLKHQDLICLGDKVGEDYNSAFKKQFLGYKYMYEQTQNNDEVQWYYLVGCDTFAFGDNITNLLKGYNSKQDLYIGGERHSGHVNHYLKNPPNFDLRYASGGPGFFISKSLMKKMYPLLETFIYIWPEVFHIEYNNKMHPAACDNALAYFLWRYLNILETIVHDSIDGFYHSRIEEYGQIIDKPIAFHYVKPEEMYQYYTRKYS